MGEERRDVVDQAGLVAVDQVGQEPPENSGSRSFCFQGSIVSVQVLERVIRYSGVLEPAAAQREPAGGRHPLAHPRAVCLHHLHGIVLQAHLAHRFDDGRQPLLPIAFNESVQPVIAFCALS